MSTPKIGENESSGMGGSRSSKRRRNFVLIGTLAAVVLGGVLVAGVLPLGDRAGTAGSSCGSGGGEANTCVLGDIGPGGGIVFSVNEGASTGGRYLEAAPNTWSGGSTDPMMEWGQAMSAAAGYTGGGMSWILPSKDQLGTLSQQKTVVGGFTAYGYWSSSSEYDEIADFAWDLDFGFNLYNLSLKDSSLHVRPVRVF
jgi:hypothetical protein